MNRHFLLSAVILAAVCCPVGECYAWAPPLYIDSDWTVYAPVGQTAIIDAWVTSGGPVYSWSWSWGGYQDQYDQEYSSMSWGQYDSSGVYSAYVDADSAGGSDDAHSYVYAVAVTEVISSTSATCVGQNVTFGAQSNPPNCAHLVTVTWSGGGTPSTGSGSQFTTSWSTGGTKTVTATCGSSSAQKQVTIVEVIGVSATTDAACVGQNVHFAAVTEPPNSAQLVTVTWSGGQNPATGSGSQWTTNWSTPGPKTVIATCGDSSAPKDVTVVKVDRIQWYDNYTSSYIDMPNPLYVVKGQSVLLKAIKDPSSASWPSGKPVWGGTAGLSGTGEQKVLNVSTVSSSSTDYKTVTVECGNTVTGNTIIYDFTGKLDPNDYFAARSAISYGLEEIVDLSYTMAPSDLTATQVGGLKWYKYSGPGSVTGGSDGIGSYDAGSSTGDVNLFLRVESGPCRAYNKNYFKVVVAPNGTRMTRVDPNNVWHIQYTASAGIKLYYWLDPKSVSFKNLTFGEGSCPSTNVSGFYLTCEPWLGFPPPTNSYPNGTQQAGHTQNIFGVILGGNSTTGCRVSAADYASTGAANPYAAGSFTWSIPTQYIDGRTTRHSFGSNQNHVSTYNAGGGATQSKGGQSGSTALNDPNSPY